MQEPWTRVALKVVRQSLVYLEEISEISPAARFTVRPRYSNLLAELLSQTKPGAEPRQAPRVSCQNLGGHREDSRRLPGTGIHPTVCVVLPASDVVLSEVSTITEAWSQDSCATLRPLSRVCSHTVKDTWASQEDSEEAHVFLDKCCWLCGPELVCDVGFKSVARPGSVRARLPVAFLPDTNHAGIREAEMSYDARLATTTRLHKRLVAEGQQLLDPALCVYWTPHSPRSFVATCCAALGVAKAERNVLGRWAQNQSDTNVRLQRTLVQKRQLLVVSVIRGRGDVGAVLWEGESLQELEFFLEKRGVDREGQEAAYQA